MRHIKWNDQLAQFAEAAAAKCSFDHTPPPMRQNVAGFGYIGENIYVNTAKTSFKDAIDSWGSEEKDYDLTSNTCRAMCGHYTQITWSKTSEVGCAVSKCANVEGFGHGGYLIFCNYGHGGNMQGEKPFERGTVGSKCQNEFNLAANSDGLCGEGSSTNAGNPNPEGNDNNGIGIGNTDNNGIGNSDNSGIGNTDNDIDNTDNTDNDTDNTDNDNNSDNTNENENNGNDEGDDNQENIGGDNENGTDEGSSGDNQGECKDEISYCHDWVHACRKPWATWARWACRKSCNFCGNDGNTAGGDNNGQGNDEEENPNECKDEIWYCNDWLQSCGEPWSTVVCRKSCKFC